MTDRETIWTSAPEVRAIFNSAVLPRVARGEVREHVRDSGPPSPRSNQPPGALSQTVLYLEGRQIVAEAHRFLLKDGSIGGSGLPDPKWVLHEETVLIAE